MKSRLDSLFQKVDSVKQMEYKDENYEQKTVKLNGDILVKIIDDTLNENQKAEKSLI